MASVACIGECMVELSEQPGGTLTRLYGGDTSNTALYLARLAVPVDYVTALGNDPFSDEMVRSWAAEGIGTDLIPRVPGALPGLYLIRTDGAGERSFFYWRDRAPVRRLFGLPEIDAGLLARSPIVGRGRRLGRDNHPGTKRHGDRHRLIAGGHPRHALRAFSIAAANASSRR